MRRYLERTASLEAIPIETLAAAAAGAAPTDDAGQPTKPPVTNDEATLNPGATDPALVVTADLPEQTEELGDFTAEIEEVTLIVDQVDNAGEVIDTLEEVAGVMQDAPEGELTDAAVKLAAVATERLFDHVGYSVSLEDEGDGKPGQHLLNKITEGAKKIWAKIIAAIEKARVWLGTFFNKLIDRSTKVKKKANELGQLVAGLQGTSTEKSFADGGLAARLQVKEGKLPARVSDAAVTTHNLLVLQFKRIDADTADGKKMAKALVLEPNKFVYNPDKRRQASRLGDTGEIYERGMSYGKKMALSETLLGGKLIGEEINDVFNIDRRQGRVERTGKNAMFDMMATPHLVYPTSGKYLPATPMDLKDAPIPVAHTSELKACCDMAGKMADEVTGFRTTKAKLESICREFIAESKRLMEESETARNLRLSDTANYVRWFYNSAPRMFVREPAEFASEMLASADSLLVYVRECARRYPKPAKA